MPTPDLGDVKKVFKPGLDNLIAGIIIGCLMMGGGGAVAFFPSRGVWQSGGDLPLWAEGRWCWGAVAMLWTVGIALFIGGYFMIQWMRSLFSLRVHVCTNGLSVIRRNAVQLFPWQEISLVQENHVYERPPLLKGAAKYLLPKVLSKGFVVRRMDGVEFGFDGTSIKEHTELADLIKKETDSRNVPWEIVEVHL